MKCSYCSSGATWELLWADGRAVVRCCSSHKRDALAAVLKNEHSEVVGFRKVRAKIVKKTVKHNRKGR